MDKQNHRFSNTNLKIAGAFASIYLAWTTFFVGFRSDHLSFLLFVLVMFFASKTTRNLTLGLGFFIIYWIIYDGMRVLPNYEVNPVHITEPYELEKSLFGISYQGDTLTPNEYCYAHKASYKGFLSGLFYLTWVPFPMLLSVYFFFKNKPLLIRFSFTFLLTNLVGFVIYYLYPAAPPWYLIYHSGALDFTIPGNAAQLVEFDQVIGYPLFEGMYNKNANVFAAIPSLHAAYPIVTFYFGRKINMLWLKVLLFIDILGIWVAAVYSLHHYIIDLLLGGLCAGIGILIYESIFNRKEKRTFLDTYADLLR